MNIESIVKHLFRLGEVTAIYDDKGYVQVTFFDRDEEARDLPMFSFINEYDMPNLKDTVLCFFLPFFKDGLCLGRFWSDSHTPPTDIKRTVWYKKLRSKGDVSFDDETETLTLNVKNIVLNYDSITYNGTSNTINAAITQTGNYTQTGDFTSSGTITGNTDVIAKGKSGYSHTHTDSQGGTTTAPN